MDLAHLRDLLGLLQDMDVAAFSAGGITVTFRQHEALESPPSRARTQAEVKEDEDASTSSVPVRGFSSQPPPSNVWKNPALWPQQGGKVIKFDGSFGE